MAEDDFPRTRLANGELEVSIYLPHAERGYYRGTRFDWSGIIESVQYRGHRFYAPLHVHHDPQLHDAVSGPADEFAMFNPMGFAEAAPGETFVKIGVGLLEKGPDDQYRFSGDYRLRRAGEWQVEPGPDRIRFAQDLFGERGWACCYRKTIELPAGEPWFDIGYRLQNTGTRAIDIDHYNHNFTRIDDTPYGPDYQVEFAFSTSEPRPIDDVASFRGNTIEVERALEGRSLWIELYQGPGRSDYNTATVRNRRTGAAVSFEGDAPIERMVFWAVERAACPEPFSRIRLDPGETTTWSSRYRFGVEET